jgi:hypothetical protein
VAPRSLRIEGVTLFWKVDQIAVMLRSKDGEVAKDVQRRAYAVQKRAKRQAPYRYGTLRRGIRVESTRESPTGPYSTVVSTARHTLYVVFGRPEVRPDERMTRKADVRQTSVTAKGRKFTARESELRPALKFQAYRGQRKIFRYGPVRAVKPNNFMQDSIDAALD